MKKYLKLMIITSVVALLPIVAGGIFWSLLPEQLPVHWNTQGEVDGYTPKPFAVIGMPLILLTLQWLGAFTMLADPKHKTHSGKLLQIGFWIIPVLSVVLGTVTYSVALGYGVRVEVVVPVSLGLLLTVIGNYMPKCRQNYTVGIKLPWTLHSEENWNRTHRLAGWLWVGGGLITVVTAFFGNVLWSLIPVLIMVLVPTVYSYILYRKGI